MMQQVLIVIMMNASDEENDGDDDNDGNHEYDGNDDCKRLISMMVMMPQVMMMMQQVMMMMQQVVMMIQQLLTSLCMHRVHVTRSVML